MVRLIRLAPATNTGVTTKTYTSTAICCKEKHKTQAAVKPQVKIAIRVRPTW